MKRLESLLKAAGMKFEF